ncbi:hypothetical protein RUM43_006491 [Polyplax serrata]|uniref:Uncharacterized protein n=1 Tax=Polyplax serrata TaxID=468196 RepID=A0AAN8S3Q7_POLSC
MAGRQFDFLAPHSTLRELGTGPSPKKPSAKTNELTSPEAKHENQVDLWKKGRKCQARG